MTRERLQALSLEDLQKIAVKGNISFLEDSAKEDLVSTIIDAFEEDRKERDEMYNLAVRITSKKFDVSLIEELDLSNEEEIELPLNYRENRIVLMLRDPSWAFLYWDLEDKKREEMDLHPGFKGLFLRIYEMDGLQKEESGVIDFFDIPVTTEDSRRYINLPEMDTCYMAELRISLDESDLQVLQSNIIANSREFVMPPRNNESENTDLLIKLSGFSTDVGDFPGTEARGIVQRRILPVDQEDVE